MSRICLAWIALVLFSTGAMAECGGIYRVKQGDSLSHIADRLYKDARKWTRLHTENIELVGEDPNTIQPGTRLRLSCINGLPLGLEGAPTPATPLQADLAEPAPAPKPEPAPTPEIVARADISLVAAPEPRVLRVVTGDDFAPFTDRNLMRNGLLAEVVETALNDAVGREGHDTLWINDWGSHLDPLLSHEVVELAFPWSRPDCEGDPGQERCAQFLYSDPMFEYLVLLFVDSTRPIPFVDDSDIEGRMLCRPDGFPLDVLDKNGRNWAREGKVILMQPYKVSDCFRLLVNGEVDAVVLNEFTARTAIAELGLGDRIEAVSSRPVAVTGLHVLAYRSNPRAEEALGIVNAGLRQIKADGRYNEIVARHMERIWAEF